MNFNIFSIFNRVEKDRSPLWKKVRKEHLKKENVCQGCGTKKGLQVHHIIPVHVDGSLELDPSNLITLCDSKCHLLFGHLMDYKSWNPDVVQDCLAMQKKIRSRVYND